MSDWKQFKNLQDASASVVRSLEGEVATWKQRAEAAERELAAKQAIIDEQRKELNEANQLIGTIVVTNGTVVSNLLEELDWVLAECTYLADMMDGSLIVDHNGDCK